MKNILDAERIPWWALNFCPCTMNEEFYHGMHCFSLLFNQKKKFLNCSTTESVCHYCPLFVLWLFLLTSELDSIGAHVTLIKCFLSLTHLWFCVPCLCQSVFFVANMTHNYCHLHPNTLVFFCFFVLIFA